MKKRLKGKEKKSTVVESKKSWRVQLLIYKKKGEPMDSNGNTKS